MSIRSISEITKEEAKQLIKRWKQEDKTLTLAERVFVLEHYMRRLQFWTWWLWW